MRNPNTSFLPSKEIASLSDYIDFVKATSSEGNIILFRGQREDFDLLPKIARLKTRGKVTDTEQRMIDDFKRRSIPFLTVDIKDEWNWLALAQHHGLATRLLDWTPNPLAALWFAVEKLPVEDHPGVIWIYEPKQDDIVVKKDGTSPFMGTLTQVFQPDHIASRIVAQGGWFTVHKYQSATKGRPERFIALNNLPRAKPLMKKLIIPAASFATLRQELNRCGINSSSIYPGLDGLCSHIQWTNSLLDDEQEVSLETIKDAPHPAKTEVKLPPKVKIAFPGGIKKLPPNSGKDQT